VAGKDRGKILALELSRSIGIHRTFDGGFPAGVGSEIEYPVPLFVHNTFIEAGKGHVVKGSELRN